jgi:WD40-like Beta Propeller Repeat
MNADGTGVTKLTDDPALDRQPAWSPDGQKIVFSRIAAEADLWTMNADGTSETQLTQLRGQEGLPRWSPDGQWIAYELNSRVFKVHSDGTGNVNLTPSPASGGQPDWSPEGLAISFNGSDGTQNGLFTMKPDGTGKALQLTSQFAPDLPVWSPDGTEFVGGKGSQIPIYGYGSQNAQVITSIGSNTQPDWQPVNPPPPVPGYPRPKGASPLRASLVPAFDECTAPNAVHGPPLSFGSCAPPTQSSPNLTVGTPDVNGEPAASVGSILYKVVGGDVRVTVNVTDVRCRTAAVATCAGGALSDYTGELQATNAINVTDRINGRFANEPGTFEHFRSRSDFNALRRARQPAPTARWRRPSTVSCPARSSRADVRSGSSGGSMCATAARTAWPARTTGRPSSPRASSSRKTWLV